VLRIGGVIGVGEEGRMKEGKREGKREASKEIISEEI
jgi:hypothetical protein